MQPTEVPEAGAATPAEARGAAPAAAPPPAPPRSSPAPAPAPPPSRAAASGNHLLNFRSYAGPPPGRGAAGAPPPPGRRRPPRARPAPYDRAAFVHSNFRFLVSDAVLAEARYREDPDLPLDWDDICLVETLAAAPPTCPIALAPLSAADAPVITPCGHLFGAAAIAAHLTARGGAAAAGPCPLCFAPVAARELRLAAVRLAAPPAVGEEAAFALLRRRRDSILPFAVGAPAATASGSAPPRCDQFSKFTAVADPSALWAEAGAALAAAAARLRAEGGSEAPGELAAVAAATEALAARARAWTERRARALLERAEDVAAAGPGPEDAGRAAAEAVRAAANAAAAAAARRAGRSAAAAALDAAFPALAVAASPPRAAGWPRGGDAAAPAPPPPAAALAPSSAQQPTSAPAAAPAAAASSSASADDLFLFQLADGQPVFLHPLNARMLAVHHGSFAACPSTVAARVLELEAAAQDEGVRRRLRALAHLPLCARFALAEVDLAPLLPPAALAPFAEELAARAARRAGRARKAAAAARREAAAEAAARRAAARTGISAAELRAMPLPGEAAPAASPVAADEDEDDDGFEAYDAAALGTSPGALGVSFAAIARDGFGATGPALGGPEAAPGGAALLGAWGARPAAPAPPPPGDAGGTPRRSKKGLVLLSSTQRRY
jgi:hypothetical protein